MNAAPSSLVVEPPARTAPARVTGARRDFAVVVLTTVGTFLLASLLELSEGVRAWLLTLERYQVDELPAAIVVMIAGLSWYSWRRSRQASDEMQLRLGAQQALSEQRANFEVLFTENLSGNLMADRDGVISLANPALATIVGLDAPAAVVGRRLDEFYADPGAWREHRDRLAEGGRVELSGFPLRRADGETVTAIGRLTGRRTPQGLLEVHAFFTDVTALESVRSDLARAVAENRFLSQRGIQMLEEERRHIARELHDEMGQWLNALKIDAVSIRDRADLPAEVAGTAHSIVELTNHVYDVVRNLMRRLRPVALDELGLAPAVQYLVDQWRRRQPDVKCVFSSEGLPESLGEVANITIYRLVQECLTNITKHAAARTVDIRLERPARGETVLASVRDDGRGMESDGARLGFGLLGMRERIEMQGGQFWVESEAGAGTVVKALVPVGPAGA
ncbi:MAG: histidine kinase [Burkholderiales bacterium]